MLRKRHQVEATLSENNHDQMDVDDDDDDDDGDFSISQVTPGFAVEKSPNVSEPGVLDNVCLRNFMCHEKLSVKIGKHINYIIGKNGSGKSAVMTAVVVGLGGKASVTNRGTSVKGFIKTGKSYAEVKVTLHNQGPDAFKPDLYGPLITVVRRLTAEGSSSYKLKNAQDVTISTERRELTSILDQFNIQVDNPVSILNQDTSKNFLNSKSPKDKYKFFLKATQLEQMKHTYIAANEQKTIAIDILDQKKEILPKLESDVLEWEQKYKALDAMDQMRQKVKRLENELAWAYVMQKEKGLEPIEKEFKIEESRTPKYIKKCEEFKVKVEKAVSEYTLIQKELKALSEKVKSFSDNHDTNRNVRDGKKKVFRGLQRELSSAKNELQSFSKDKQQIEERLQELRNSLENDFDKQRQLRDEKMAELHEKIDALRAQQTSTQQQSDQFKKAITHNREQLNVYSGEEQEMQQRLEQMRRQLHTLESARSNRMRRYGQHMPEVLQRVDEMHRQGKFHQRPHGPIGANVSVKDPRWAPASEMCLRSLLQSFCCHDHHDSRLLESIFKQHCPRGRTPTIIVSAFRNTLYDVSRYKAVGNFPTLLDLIEMDNPVIANCLIDQRGIESIVMFDNVEEARTVMMQRPPKNAREGFTITGDHVYAAPNFRYYSNANVKASLLTANVEDSIRQCQDDQRGIEVEMSTRRQQNKQLHNQVQQNQTQAKRCDDTLKKIRTQINSNTYELNELQNMEEPVPQEDIATLEVDSQQIEKQIVDQKKNVHDIQARYTDAKQESDKADAQFSQADEKLQVSVEKSTEIKERLGKAEKAIDDSKFHRRHYEDKKKEHDTKVQELMQQRDHYQQEITADVAKAQQVCEERISTRRSPDNLVSEINQIRHRIEAEEETRGSRNEITRTFHDKLTTYKQIKKEVGQHALFLQELKKVMKSRKEAYDKFQRMIATRAKYFFIMMLNNRQYTGKINFNHKEESLNLDVQPNGNQVVSASDMRSLSGGERSFATVCFILALWDTMESPFRMLDEFDVYMDMVNRRIAMDLMLSTAKKKTKHQFIFLTPLDMSYMKMPSSAKIIQMFAPERGQTTLPFKRRRKQDDDESNEAD